MTLLLSPETHAAGLAAGAFVLSLALVWLGAGVAAAARLRAAPLSQLLGAVGAALVASGLWWPAHVTVGTAQAGDAPGWSALLAWGVCLVLVAAARAGAEWIHAGKLGHAVGAILAAFGAAYGYAMFATPGVFRIAAQAGPGAAAVAMIVTVVALTAAHAVHANLRAMYLLHFGGVLATAGMAVVAAALSMPAAAAAPVSSGIEWFMLVALAALAGALRVVLRAGENAEPARRAERPVAAVDGLTQLPTRIHFESRLEGVAKHCTARGQRLALFFIDLDGFKPVNDAFKHSTGDRVLEQVGARLRAMVTGRDMAARVGGDEFLLLAYGTASNDAAAQVAKRLIERLSEPYKVDGRELTISCSVGIAMYPDDCEPAKLIARADVAMYAAKRSGGAKHCFYAPQMDANAQANFDLVSELRQGIANGELELYYQPKMDARSGQVTAVEALVRWRHPTRGQLLPGEFIPLAERFGLIGALGNWVIEDACRQSRAWREKGLRMRVAINLSVHQMRQDDIVERIAQALKKYRIHPSLLTCEITESAAMENTHASQETFRRLGELGAHLSIDDFGTGYSSLAYLEDLPAKELKIDRRFVMNLESNPRSRAVAEAVVKMAHALGKKVVAEGVENTRQQQILASFGCDEMQGYLFAKPMTASVLLRWALDGKSQATGSFRTSLFGETREASRVAPNAVASVNASRGA